jgi:formylglycine-generating enzyme required for sulfatase activity
MWPSTFDNIDFIKVDVPNTGNYDKNIYEFSKSYEKRGEIEYFYRISKYPITNKLYNIFLTQNSEQINENNELPVVNISFLDACYYCNWLTTGSKDKGLYKIENGIVRLLSKNGYYIPNENEWHKAAFYDPKTEQYFLYATGSNIVPKKANYFSADRNIVNFLYEEKIEDSLLQKNYESRLTGKLTPVCSFINTFSPFGTFDQNGNVWELVDTKDNNVKTLKGGSAYSSSYSLKSTFSSVCSIYTKSKEIGFRVCKGF